MNSSNWYCRKGELFRKLSGFAQEQLEISKIGQRGFMRVESGKKSLCDHSKSSEVAMLMVSGFLRVSVGRR
jgi:hypothetical protein